MSKKKKIRIDSALLMEDLRQEITGMQSFIGVFSSKVNTPSIPLRLPKVVFRVSFQGEEDFPADCMLSVVNPSGKQIFNTQEPIRADVKKGFQNIVAVGWSPAVFTEAGVYQVRFSVDGRAMKALTFEIQEAGASQHKA